MVDTVFQDTSGYSEILSQKPRREKDFKMNITVPAWNPSVREAEARQRNQRTHSKILF